MHTEPEIRRAIKPIIEKYGQLNTTELKAILSEYIEYDEENNFSRTYLVKDKTTKEIASYFSIRTGLITMQVQDVHQNKSSSFSYM